MYHTAWRNIDKTRESGVIGKYGWYTGHEYDKAKPGCDFKHFKKEEKAAGKMLDDALRWRDPRAFYETDQWLDRYVRRLVRCVLTRLQARNIEVYEKGKVADGQHAHALAVTSDHLGTAIHMLGTLLSGFDHNEDIDPHDLDMAFHRLSVYRKIFHRTRAYIGNPAMLDPEDFVPHNVPLANSVH